MIVKKEIGIDYGHRVPNHESKCFSPHGHRGVVIATIEGPMIEKEGDSQQGMVIDFSHIKQGLMNIVDGTFDHAFVVYDQDPFADMLKSWSTLSPRTFKVVRVNYVPTAENLAAHIFQMMDRYLRNVFPPDVVLTSIEFRETPTSIAIATRADITRDFLMSPFVSMK